MSVQVQAHRGLSAEQPENTVAAFRAAAEAGFDVIELDLRTTHDGEVVALHDANIARTTDGVGRVAEMDYDELAGHDTGAGPVPRLADAFDALRGTPWNGGWNLELKTASAAAGTIDLVEHHGLRDRVVVSAMDPAALRLAHEHRLATALITLGPPDEEDRAEAARLGCTWMNIDHDFLTEKVLAKTRAAGLRVGAWTVNDIEAAHRLVDAGVDAIITDRREVLEAVRLRQGQQQA